jgi:hypothetical protein
MGKKYKQKSRATVPFQVQIDKNASDFRFTATSSILPTA